MTKTIPAAKGGNLKAVIVGRIDALKASEKITKAELSAVSREVLMYVPDSDDIDVVNRLINVLTPMNRRVAILFFRHFLPWEVEEQNGEFSRFGKKLTKDKAVKRRLVLIEEFLEDEGNNIWTWAATEVQVEYKPKDFAGNITKAVAMALKGEVKDNGETPAISVEQVLLAVMSGGVSVDALLRMADALSHEELAEAA